MKSRKKSHARLPRRANSSRLENLQLSRSLGRELLEERRLLSVTCDPNSAPTVSALTKSTAGARSSFNAASIGADIEQTTAPLQSFSPTGSPLTTSATAGSPVPDGLSPSQIRHAYGVDQISFAYGLTADGSGQTIAIIDQGVDPGMQVRSDNAMPMDLHAFDQYFGLADPPEFTQVNVDNAPTLKPNTSMANNWGIETAMDVEWAHAIAPEAKILLVECADLLDGLQYVASHAGISVVSMSWSILSLSGGEFAGEANDDRYFTDYADSHNVTFVASSGDNATVEWPSSSPHALAVGGAMFTSPLDANGDYTTESAWPLGGGGISGYEEEPYYQKPVFNGAGTGRAVPDVSFDAGSGVSVYDSFDFAGAPWLSEGGTSLSAPCWAGLIAIADQGAVAIGNPILQGDNGIAQIYALDIGGYASFAYPVAFHDIVQGGNHAPAGPGYDLATGLGTPYAPALIAFLSGNVVAPTTIAPSGTIYTASPKFQWSSVPGAIWYDLEVRDTVTGAKLIDTMLAADSSTTAGIVSYQASSGTLAPGHSYSWQIQARGNGLYQHISPPWSQATISLPAIPAPSLTTPGDNALVTSKTPTLQWSGVPGAAYYELTLTDETGAAPVSSSIQVPGTSYTPTNPLTVGDSYTWSVRAFDDFNGQTLGGTTSAPSTFTEVSAGAAQVLSPLPQSTVATQTPILEWSAVPGIPYYELSLIDITANVALLDDLYLTDTSFTPTVPLANGHSYEWRILLPTGVTTQSFFTVSVPSGPSGSIVAPTLIGPAGLTPSPSDTPTFQWSPVSGASGYGLYLFGAMTSQLAPIKVSTTSYTLPQPASLPSAPIVYTWWVVAYDASGDVSAPSSPLSFTVPPSSPPLAPPTPVAPSGVLTTYTPTFQWTGVSGAGYAFYLVDETSANSGPWGQNVISAFTSSTSYTLGSPTVGNFEQPGQLINGHSYPGRLRHVR